MDVRSISAILFCCLSGATIASPSNQANDLSIEDTVIFLKNKIRQMEERMSSFELSLAVQGSLKGWLEDKNEILKKVSEVETQCADISARLQDAEVRFLRMDTHLLVEVQEAREKSSEAIERVRISEQEVASALESKTGILQVKMDETREILNSFVASHRDTEDVIRKNISSSTEKLMHLNDSLSSRFETLTTKMRIFENSLLEIEKDYANISFVSKLDQSLQNLDKTMKTDIRSIQSELSPRVEQLEGRCALCQDMAELNKTLRNHTFQINALSTDLLDIQNTCSEPPSIVNGYPLISLRRNRDGAIVTYACRDNMTLVGNGEMVCRSGEWTGVLPECMNKTFCDQLRTNSLLHVKPAECGIKPMPYRAVCQYYCSVGYILVHNGDRTDGILKCEDNKKWSGGYGVLSCKDNEPPKIKCPKSIEIDAERYKDYAHVVWDIPTATDNVPHSVVKVEKVEPLNLRKSRPHNKDKHAFFFPIGRTKVVYEATDYSELSSTCSFIVQVLDKEPPAVLSCPADIEIYHHSNEAIPVNWEEPVFKDNSKNLKSVVSSRKSGDKFGWGPAMTVHYHATDEANNTAVCSFQVKVKHYPCPHYDTPANGVVACDDWLDGRICKVFCHDGFQFAIGRNFDSTHFCKQVTKSDGTVEGSWQIFRSGSRLQLPWPDCTRKQEPATLNATDGLKFGPDSCSEESLQKFRERFMSIRAFRLELFCPKSREGCSQENVKIKCSPASARDRRSLQSDTYNNFSEKSRRGVPQQVLAMSFKVHEFPNAADDDTALKRTNEPGEEDKTDFSSSDFMKNLQTNIARKGKDAYKMDVLPEPAVQYNVTVVCSVGQISLNYTCVNCPAGTYKDGVSETCIDCSTATYQDEERQLSCKGCPKGFTTYGVKSKSADDCKAPCERGSFSGTGYEPCSMCRIGSFQDAEGQTNCTICPNRTTTKIKGAKHSDACEETFA